ncbi:hypothetical protein ACFV3O_29570, partial [Streptomyces albidoflavus]
MSGAELQGGSRRCLRAAAGLALRATRSALFPPSCRAPLRAVRPEEPTSAVRRAVRPADPAASEAVSPASDTLSPAAEATAEAPSPA